MQLSAAETLRICPPCTEQMKGKQKRHQRAKNRLLSAALALCQHISGGESRQLFMGSPPQHKVSTHSFHHAAVYLHSLRVHLHSKQKFFHSDAVAQLNSRFPYFSLVFVLLLLGLYQRLTKNELVHYRHQLVWSGNQNDASGLDAIIQMGLSQIPN